MKNYYLLAAVLSTGCLFASCEDVAAPYVLEQESENSSSSEVKNLPFSSTSLSDFTTYTPDDYPEKAGWSSGSAYTQVTGYVDADGDGNKEYNATESWLVSPAFKTVCSEENGVAISFDYTIRYGSSADMKANHKIMVSTNYDGEVPLASWTEVVWTPSASSYSDWTTYPSGTIMLPKEFWNRDTVYVALRYACQADSKKVTTWELMNFLCFENKYVADTTTVGDPFGYVKDVTEGTYLIGTNTGETIKLLSALTGNYGWGPSADGIAVNGIVKSSNAAEQWTISAVEGGYQIKDAEGKIYYMGGTYNSFNRAESIDGDSAIWTISINDGGYAVIKNKGKGKTLSYGASYGTYGAYATVSSTLPCLFCKDAKAADTKVPGEVTSTPPTVDPKGTGTEADPFNVAAAIAKCKETDTIATANVYFVEGLVKYVDNSGAAQFGNLSLDLVDVVGSTTVFKAYRVIPENGKFAGTEIKVGDKVFVKGKLINYNSKTPETVANSYVIKVNGSALEVKPTILAAASTNVDWDKTTAKVAISVVNGTEGGAVTATSLTTGATCTVESDGLAVTLPSQNTTEANIEYEFKLSYPGAVDVTIKVVQKKKPVEGETKLMTSSLTWTNGTNAYNNSKGTVNGTAVDPIYKLAKSGESGSATVTIPEGATKVVFYAVAWKSIPATLKVGGKEVSVAANVGATSNSPFTLTVTDDDYYEVDVTAGDVKFECDKRVLIFGLNAK